ncbi:hypothetical protein THIX_60360 [Thiomonas sp. X19]|nr:hypothetical protein THIX_60360 [Thiomonas sp. X19]
MHGAIVIEPVGGATLKATRDHVVQLSDWTDEDPMRVMAKLKADSGYYNYNQPTATEFFHDVAPDGLKAALEKRRMWNKMRMSPNDLVESVLSVPSWHSVCGAWLPIGSTSRPPAILAIRDEAPSGRLRATTSC